jgi:hypothetical protein
MLKNIFIHVMCIYNTSISPNNYLRTSLIIGNLMITWVTSVEWTWLGYLKLKGDYEFG